MKNTMETCNCTCCGKTTPFTDDGGRCETDLGWLCNDCIKQLTEQQYQLHFEDEDMGD